MELRWKTAKEIKSKAYIIEKSVDGHSWSAIANRNSANSAAGQLYVFKDFSPIFGRGYYRLKMEDIDQTVTYSQVIVVEQAKTNQVALYPTDLQLHEGTWLEGNFGRADLAQVAVMNLEGKLLSYELFSGHRHEQGLIEQFACHKRNLLGKGKYG
jgi:hypothetical protein